MEQASLLAGNVFAVLSPIMTDDLDPNLVSCSGLKVSEMDSSENCMVETFDDIFLSRSSSILRKQL